MKKLSKSIVIIVLSFFLQSFHACWLADYYSFQEVKLDAFRITKMENKLVTEFTLDFPSKCKSKKGIIIVVPKLKIGNDFFLIDTLHIQGDRKKRTYAFVPIEGGQLKYLSTNELIVQSDCVVLYLSADFFHYRKEHNCISIKDTAVFRTIVE